MSTAIDLGRYIQRRHVRAYEREMARGTYAYGVDVRRARWLTTSALGQAAMRSIEHAWFRLADELIARELAYPDGPGAIPLLNDVIELCQLLHTTPPAVRVVTPAAREARAFGLVTPLGDPRSSDDWLVVDAEALAALPAPERAFLLAAGLAHLQCGHGVLFIAHLVGLRRGGHGVLRRALLPWTRVAAFSADRAGLLAAGDLDAALRALALEIAAAPAWAPSAGALAARRVALEEFAESAALARARTRRAVSDEAPVALEALVGALPGAEADGGEPADGPAARPEPPRAPEAGVPDGAWTLARCDQRLTRRLGLF